jgi:hypothetical protein
MSSIYVTNAGPNKLQTSASNLLVISPLSADTGGTEDPEGLATLEGLERFMRWLSQLLLSSLYPSAPYERKQMAMELLGCLLEVWNPGQRPEAVDDVRWLWPYEDDVMGREATLVLVGAVVDR